MYFVSCCQEIDIKNEIIVLANTTNTELKDLPKRIPKDSARYHFFLYKHSHEGDYLESIGKILVEQVASSLPVDISTVSSYFLPRTVNCTFMGSVYLV